MKAMYNQDHKFILIQFNVCLAQCQVNNSSVVNFSIKLFSHIPWRRLPECGECIWFRSTAPILCTSAMLVNLNVLRIQMRDPLNATECIKKKTLMYQSQKADVFLHTFTVSWNWLCVRLWGKTNDNNAIKIYRSSAVAIIGVSLFRYLSAKIHKL